MTKHNKTLVIVESPKKAQTLTKYLGSKYILKASFGHMYDLPKKELGIDVKNNYEPTFELMDDKHGQLKGILDAASQVDDILIASDADREGEAIGWHIAKALEKTKKPIKRVWLKELTKKEIEKSIKNLMDLDENLVEAQKARRALDRLVGYTISPYVIRNFGKNLSAGRCQSVVVKMIVDREREIENFKPEEYWNIQAYLLKSLPKNESGKFYAKYVEKITDKTKALKVKDDLDKSVFTIFDVEEKTKEKKPLPPFITTSLQIAASTKLKFATTKTMNLAQSLFDSSLITYHRVDSTRLSEEAVEECRAWLVENKHPIPTKPNVYAAKATAQNAHEAIRPTDVTRLPESLMISEDEKKLYKLIWERFVACQMRSALYDTVVVTINASVNNHKLKAAGRILKFKGWLDLLPDDEEDDGDIKLPILNKDDALTLTPPGVSAEQKFTRPPGRFTVGTLTKELERRSIGRPATMATITSKVKDRNYVEEKKEIYYPTELGKKISDDLAQYFEFLKYDYSAELELKLDLIADGKLTYLKMMEDFYPLLVEQLKKATASRRVDYGFKCRKCNSAMDLKNGQFGYYLSCINYPDCNSSMSCDLVDGKPVIKDFNGTSANLVPNVKCSRCGSGMIRKDGKFGPFHGCSTWPKCTNIQQILAGKKCVKCQNEMVIKVFNEELKLGCMGYPNCANIEDVPKGMKIEWKNPADLNKGEVSKKVKKVSPKSVKW